VTLSVTDDDGASSVAPASQTVSPTAPNQAPTANYTWSATDLTVDFTDTSTDGDGTIATWAWDFGDGNTSTVQNPQHTYASAGDYTVTLSVTDDDGAASAAAASQTVSVTVTVTFEVNAIAPDTLTPGSTTSDTISGSGFAPGATVTFENGIGPAPTVESEPVVAIDGSEITVTLNVKTGGPKRERVWNVRVTNPDASTAVLEGGLVVSP
jgi:PKD repeat protein